VRDIVPCCYRNNFARAFPGVGPVVDTTYITDTAGAESVRALLPEVRLPERITDDLHSSSITGGVGRHRPTAESAVAAVGR